MAHLTPTEKQLAKTASKRARDRAWLMREMEELAWPEKDREAFEKSIDRIFREQEKRANCDALHEELKKHWKGRTLYFGNRLQSHSLTFGRNKTEGRGGWLTTVNDIDASTAKFWHYQPRARRLWLQFSGKDIKNCEYDDNVYHFSLARAVGLDLQTTPPAVE